MNINTLSSYTSLCACGHHMCSLPCIKVYTHTRRCTSTERPVLRNRLTWSRRLGCPWSAICKLVVSLAYPSPEAPEQQHGCCEWAVSLQAWGPACGAGLGRPPLPARLSSSASKRGAVLPRTGAGVRVGGRRLTSALRLQPPLETLPDAQKSRPADDPGSCDPVNLTQKMHRSRHHQYSFLRAQSCCSRKCLSPARIR